MVVQRKLLLPERSSRGQHRNSSELIEENPSLDVLLLAYYSFSWRPALRQPWRMEETLAKGHHYSKRWKLYDTSGGADTAMARKALEFPPAIQQCRTKA
jgi:hypothetical protein